MLCNVAIKLHGGTNGCRLTEVESVEGRMTGDNIQLDTKFNIKRYNSSDTTIYDTQRNKREHRTLGFSPKSKSRSCTNAGKVQMGSKAHHPNPLRAWKAKSGTSQLADCPVG